MSKHKHRKRHAQHQGASALPSPVSGPSSPRAEMALPSGTQLVMDFCRRVVADPQPVFGHVLYARQPHVIIAWCKCADRETADEFEAILNGLMKQYAAPEPVGEGEAPPALERGPQGVPRRITSREVIPPDNGTTDRELAHVGAADGGE